MISLARDFNRAVSEAQRTYRAESGDDGDTDTSGTGTGSESESEEGETATEATTTMATRRVIDSAGRPPSFASSSSDGANVLQGTAVPGSPSSIPRHARQSSEWSDDELASTKAGTPPPHAQSALPVSATYPSRTAARTLVRATTPPPIVHAASGSVGSAAGTPPRRPQFGNRRSMLFTDDSTGARVPPQSAPAPPTAQDSPPPYSSITPSIEQTPPRSSTNQVGPSPSPQRRSIYRTFSDHIPVPTIPSIPLPSLPIPDVKKTITSASTSLTTATSNRLSVMQSTYSDMSDRATPYFQSAFVFLLAAVDVFLCCMLLTVEMLWAGFKTTGKAAWKVGATLVAAERKWPPTEATLTALQSHLSTYLIDLTVLGSVFPKRSPLPDLISVAAERGFDAYNGVEKRYAVRERTVDLTQMILRWALWLGSVAATAGVKGALAYQRAPSWNDRDPSLLARRSSTRTSRHSSRSSRHGHKRRPRRPADSRSVSDGDGDLVARLPPTRWSGTISRTIGSLMSPAPPDPRQKIRISVGGHVFSTTLSTLRHAPPGSRLSLMFSDTNIRHLPLDEDGAYFVDRDGGQFRHVLNWLRGEDSHVTVDDVGVMREVKGEAEWYGLAPLVAAADHQLQLLQTAHGNQRSASRASSFADAPAGSGSGMRDWMRYLTSSGSEAGGGGKAGAK
ncbi:BTB/POZ domain-containing protein kctd14 [Gonapodya sp. JEL0774]|nr:BTB/POZ domain-containing protein kctd14 [Gonapodya sp. JEL0774]